MERSESLKVPSVMLNELFIVDKDGQQRELGIGDPVVGKHVGKVVSAMGGRLEAYREGLAGDDSTLAEAVRRNLTMADGWDGRAIASGLRALAGSLAGTSDEALLAGKIAP
jgi:cytochrome b pre-mRNA-processing protein 3